MASRIKYDREALALMREFAAQMTRGVGKTQKSANTKGRRAKLARWPMICDRAGCMPNQVEEANANCRKMGLAARYLPDGSVEYGSERAKREHLRSIGLIDRSSYT